MSSGDSGGVGGSPVRAISAFRERPVRAEERVIVR